MSEQTIDIQVHTVDGEVTYRWSIFDRRHGFCDVESSVASSVDGALDVIQMEVLSALSEVRDKHERVPQGT